MAQSLGRPVEASSADECAGGWSEGIVEVEVFLPADGKAFEPAESGKGLLDDVAELAGADSVPGFPAGTTGRPADAGLAAAPAAAARSGIAARRHTACCPHRRERAHRHIGYTPPGTITEIAS
ncbi:hypothetical protein [Kitasatospora sp. NPDC088134]|uniref:hypothetical protein n=1 Tax=Kitasatospora sp. NPDC088134 TaxID=3364071 RepID=UPI0038113E5A